MENDKNDDEDGGKEEDEDKHEDQHVQDDEMWVTMRDGDEDEVDNQQNDEN